MRKNIVASFVFLILLCLGCTKEEFTVREYPLLESDTLVEVTQNGVKMGAKLLHRGNQTIEEYGVYWDTGLYLNRGYSDNISRSTNPNDTFMVEIKHGLSPGKEYYLWPYVRTKDYFVPGKPIKITSLGSKPPVVEEFYPKTATWNDTLYIRGSHFSKRSYEYKVNVGGINIGLIPKSDTLLSVRVPNKLNQSPCQVILVASGNKVTAPGTFTLKDPVIKRLDPDTIMPGKTLTLYGEGLHKLHSSVTIDGQEAEVYRGGGKSLVVKVPEGIHIGWNKVSVTTLDKTFNVKKGICWDVALEKMVPDSVIPGQQVQLMGRGLPHDLTRLIINGVEVSNFQINPNGLSFKAPSTMKNGWNQVVVKVGGEDVKMEKGLYSIYPIIKSVKPLQVFCGDIVEVRGENLLRDANDIAVRISNSNALKLSYQTDSLVKVQIPEVNTGIPGKLSVTAYGQTQSFSESVVWKSPIIESVEVEEASIGNYVTITGRYLCQEYGGDSDVLFGGVKSIEVKGTSEKLTALIPSSCPLEADLQVDHQGSRATWDEKIKLKKIGSVTCLETVFFRGKEFEITGINLNNSSIKVLLIDSKGAINNCVVKKMENEKLTLQVNEETPLKDVQRIEVSLGVQNEVLISELTFLEPWQKKGNYMYGRWKWDFHNLVAFSYQGVNYVGLGKAYPNHKNKYVWVIPETGDKMEEVSYFPGNWSSYPSCFQIEDKVYISVMNQGNTEIWKYNITKNVWSRLVDLS